MNEVFFEEENHSFIVCLICNKLCDNKRSLGGHVKLHNMNINEYKEKFGLFPKCNKCGKKISKNSKNGYCNKCRDRNGEKNPFYGRKHKEETIKNMKIKCAEASKSLWCQEEYRNKVISGVSKPRRESFKEEQSKRIKQWYIDNPEQKDIRSESMKNTWETGKISPTEYTLNRRSSSEIEFFNEIEKVINCKDRQVIKIENKWYMPDILLKKDMVIIEFFGDFWHANPQVYKRDDILHRGITAQEIWNRDEQRRIELEDAGYIVIIVWESEYLKKKEEILSSLDNLLNWETCAL